MRRQLSTVLVGLGLAGVAHAEPNNFLGGRSGGRVGYITGGFADIEGGVYLPVGPVELKPRLRFDFNIPFNGVVAIEAGLDLRAQLFQSGDLSGSLVAGLDFPLGIVPGGGVGFGIGLIQPGWMMTYRVEDVVDLDFGLIFEPIVIVAPNVSGVINIPLVIGVEYEVTSGIVLGFRFEGGPSIRPAGGFTGVGPYIRAHIGAAFAF